MQFLLLIAYEDTGYADAGAEERQAFADAHHAFEQAVYASGRLLSGAALADPDRAFTVRHDGTGWHRTEGPFAESAEHVGGFYLVELPDAETAGAAAQCLPRQYTVEVRPVVEIDGYERSDPPGPPA